MGSGMGGSAASAVGAVVALNALLPQPLSLLQLLPYALEGEAAASGGRHADNVAPCLWGGIVLTRALAPTPDIVSLPVPTDLCCVLAHPHLRLDTKVARAVLSDQVPSPSAVKQAAHLGAFVAGCFLNDLDLVGRACFDFIFEPQRAHLIPGLKLVQTAALDRGALACSISGAGPSVFALSRANHAPKIAQGMQDAFAQVGLQADVWFQPVSLKGCHV